MKLKLAPPVDDRPVKVTVELPASVYRDLAAYAQLLSAGAADAAEPHRLIAPMLARFMATDRAFAKSRRQGAT